MVNLYRLCFALLFIALSFSYAEQTCRKVIDESETDSAIKRQFASSGTGFFNNCKVLASPTAYQVCNPEGYGKFYKKQINDTTVEAWWFEFAGTYKDGSQGSKRTQQFSYSFKTVCEDKPEPPPNTCSLEKCESAKGKDKCFQVEENIYYFVESYQSVDTFAISKHVESYYSSYNFPTDSKVHSRGFVYAGTSSVNLKSQLKEQGLSVRDGYYRIYVTYYLVIDGLITPTKYHFSEEFLAPTTGGKVTSELYCSIGGGDEPEEPTGPENPTDPTKPGDGNENKPGDGDKPGDGNENKPGDGDKPGDGNGNGNGEGNGLSKVDIKDAIKEALDEKHGEVKDELEGLWNQVGSDLKNEAGVLDGETDQMFGGLRPKEVDVNDLEEQYVFTISAPKQCPAPYTFYLSYLKRNVSFDFSLLCQLFQMIGLLVIASSYITAIYILSGLRKA